MGVGLDFLFRVDLAPTPELFSKILAAIKDTGVIKTVGNKLAQPDYRKRAPISLDEAGKLVLEEGVELLHMLPDGRTTEILLSPLSCPPPYDHEHPTKPPFVVILSWTPGRGLWDDSGNIAENKLLSMIEIAKAVFSVTGSPLGIGGEGDRHIFDGWYHEDSVIHSWNAGLCHTPPSLRSTFAGRKGLPWAIFASRNVLPHGRPKGIEKICWRVEDLPDGGLMIIRTCDLYMDEEEDLENSKQVMRSLGLR